MSQYIKHLAIPLAMGFLMAASVVGRAQDQFKGTLSKILVDIYKTSRCQDGAIQHDTTHLVLPSSSTETSVDLSCSWATIGGKIVLQIPDVTVYGTLCQNGNGLCLISPLPPAVSISISALGALKTAIDTVLGHDFSVKSQILNVGDTTTICPQPLDMQTLKYPGSVTLSSSSTCSPPAFAIFNDSTRKFIGNQLVEFNAGHFLGAAAIFSAKSLFWTFGIEEGYGCSHTFVIRSVYRFTGGAATPEVEVWAHHPVYAGSVKFSSSKDNNVVTIGGYPADVVSAHPDSLIVRVPQELVENRSDATKIYNTTPRDIELVAKILTGPSQYTEVARYNVRFNPPRPLLFDEVTRSTPPLLQAVVTAPGPRTPRTFAFLGYATDGTAAVRLLNTAKGLARLRLMGKIISPPKAPTYPRGELFDKNDNPTIGNLLNIGILNAGIQFPIELDGWYLIVVQADTSSSGPLPAQFQIHLAGNVGLPRKLINGASEPPRGIRLDTYFNHPAPRSETLINNGLVTGQWAETGVFKFANPVSVSRFPIAVLIPPTSDGFPIGTPPVRAGPPTRMGQLPNQAIDITVPMATTTGAASPVVGTVIDLAQVPIPASVLGSGPPAGVARILGASDEIAVTLPLTVPGGTISSLIVDMGSGNEIVNGAGADFRVIALSGTYQVAVSNTPFSNTFVAVGSGTGQQDFDIAGTGLPSARYVRLSVSTGSASFDAVEALNLYTDQIHQTAGPLADVARATITMRRQKSPMTPIDPLIELIAPDGSFLGKNESGFGDDTELDRSDAALIKVSLTQQGFYRYLGRGYDTQPDDQAFGSYTTRLETAGEYDPVELTVSNKSEDQTAAQKQGTITFTRQRDSYLFQASPGTTVNIVVNGIEAPALSDPLVELYDPEDFLIAANDNYPGRGKNAVITATLPTTGRTFPDPSTYRIVVMGLDKMTGTTTSLANSVFHVRQENGGKYELKVFTGALTGEGPKAPTVVSLSPNAAVQGATNVAVTIIGTDFANGATVAFSGTGVTVKGVTFVSASQLTVTLDVDGAAATGMRDVTVTNPGGLSSSRGGLFEVRKTLGQVVLTWTKPSAGQTMTPPGNLTAQFNPGTGRVVTGKTLTGGIRRGGMKRGRILQGLYAEAPARTRGPQSIIQEVEPNNRPGQAQILYGDTVIQVNGRAEVKDVGTLVYGDDDIEDLFSITAHSPGLTVFLDGFTSDCDLFLVDPADTTVLDASLNTSPTGSESIQWNDFPAGTYLIGVSIYDPEPLGPDSTAYALHLLGDFGGTGTPTLQSYNVYRSTTSTARATGTKIGNVSAVSTSFSDPVPYTGNFYYQVTAVYDQGESGPSNEVSKVVTDVGKQVTVVPAGYALRQNYPNPFNPGTTIEYDLPRASHVLIEVYSMLGQRIRTLVDGQMPAGPHSVDWDSRTDAGAAAPSGVYMYRMVAGQFSETRKVLLLR